MPSVCLTKQDAGTAKAVEVLNAQGVTISDHFKVEFEHQAKEIYVNSHFSLDVSATNLPQNRNDCIEAGFHGKVLVSKVSRVVSAVQPAKTAC